MGEIADDTAVDVALESSSSLPDPSGNTPDEIIQLRQGQARLAAELAKLKADLGAVSKKPTGFTFKMGGQIVMDMLWFDQNAASRAAVGDVQDAFDFRRARLYANGEYGNVFTYVMGFDFAQGTGENGRPSFLDNYIGISDLPYLGNLRIGHFFEPFTLERSGSNRNTAFMERSLVDAFAPARNLGMMAYNQTEDQAWWGAAGTFRGNSDNFGDDAGDREGQTFDVRLVWRPYYDEASGGRYYLHLGTAYSYRGAADGSVRFRSRPEAFGNEDSGSAATPYFVDTGAIAANRFQLAGTELLWCEGPWMVQSEAAMTTVSTPGGLLTFHGEYLFVGYFLTGEHQPYNRALAITDRVIPFENFFRVRTDDGSIHTGRGAWQVAARLSHIDLDSGNVAGGELTDFTLGLNWFATPYHRFKFNYIRADLSQTNARTTTNIFGVRFDMDF